MFYNQLIMRLYSTKNTSEFVDLKTAVFEGLPKDNGLFMPEFIPQLSPNFIKNLKNNSFQSIAFEVAKTLLQGAIPDSDLKNIIESAIDFPAPVVRLDDDTHILELFHGPSLAFKDFGARFMAQLMSYFNRGNNKELVILVATSGDTGGAVAFGFYKTLGIKVVILYPSGKVSNLQEKQLTTLGENITALEVNGTFDDCQALVKKAFLDKELQANIRLSSANSINIARLIPQSFYYFEAYKQINAQNTEGVDRPIVFSIPSGNFGNLTAGLLAKRMGLPIHQFIAATNLNDSVPKYLSTGSFIPHPSISTLSNAMDVGNPSNFARMIDLFGGEESSTWNKMKGDIVGYTFDDETTKQAMKEVDKLYNYVIDPHAAVGYLALRAYQKNQNAIGVVLETAHPAKFLPDVEAVLGRKIDVPERLAALANKKKESILRGIDFESFKEWLLESY
jgi:threonine synthase